MAPPPTTMHAKSDSEVTSLAPSSPPRSPRRPVYYVISPSHHDPTEKLSLSFSSSPPPSPSFHHNHSHHLYASSPLAPHHSRESSDTRFSAPLPPWKRLHPRSSHPPPHAGPTAPSPSDDDDYVNDPPALDPRCYAALFVLVFFLLFSLFSLILWGCSKAYPPRVSVRSIVFHSFDLQPGMDPTGVPTKMLSLNSTVSLSFHNTATFFGVHVTSTPLDLYYSQLKVASGTIRGFYQRRSSRSSLAARVGGALVPLYGGGAGVTSRADGEAPARVRLTLQFVVRSRAYVLGRLVKSKFYSRVRCSAVLREGRLGRPVRLGRSCEYRH